MSKALMLAATFALALGATPALGQDDVSSGKDRRYLIDPTGHETIQVKTRPDASGDRYRYISEAVAEGATDEKFSQSNSLTFDIEVLGLTDLGTALRYTVRSAVVQDSAGKSSEAVRKAEIDNPMDFEVGRDGTLLALGNWAEYTTRYLARIDQLLPEADPVRARMHRLFAADPGEVARNFVLTDLRTLMVMQITGAVPVGHIDLPEEDFPIDGGRNRTHGTADVAAAGPCQVKIARTTINDLTERNGKGREELATDAVVSTLDGWVVTLMENKRQEHGASHLMETLSIRRLDPPACPA